MRIGPGGPEEEEVPKPERRAAPAAAWAIAFLGVALGSVLARGAAWGSPEPAAGLEVDLRLFLIGDAGKPAPDGEPVLRALGQELARDPTRSVVVFLGDNIYPNGLPAADARSRPEMERRLDQQIDTVRSRGARGVFVPGNHDWEKGQSGGWEAVKRQGAHVVARGAPLVDFLPRGGCPGPVVVDFDPHLRLVVLDTQWWLHNGPKPLDPVSDCGADSESEVVAALQRALGGAGDRQVVMAAHHPLETGGPHGGRFSFREHVFPLTDLNKRLWIPLPFVGSIYPLSRKRGASPQDLASDRNRHMREALEGVFRERPPLVYAAGHEHALQVIEGRSARHLLVSGAGIFGHTRAVSSIEGTRLVSGEAGFMRLDFDRAGGVRLVVLGVDAGGRRTELLTEWLTGGP